MVETLNIAAAAPEIFLSLMACLILLLRLYDNSCCKNAMPFTASIASLGLASLMLLGGFFMPSASVFPGAELAAASGSAFHGAYINDPMAVWVKALIALLSMLVLLYGWRYNRDRGYFKTEFYVLAIFGVVGMMIMASASHLLTLYVGLELFSLSVYAMVAFFRDSRIASEAAMKYFVLGALASAILLYAISLLYGLTGSLQISEIAQAVAELDANNMGLILAVVLAVVGLAFKLGAFPFHMWVPDVYQGAPTSVTAYIGAAPKLAAFAMLMRLLVEGLGAQHMNWQPMLAILAILSVGAGNIIAIAQSNIKRMLAYSTISHMGFFLFGILSGTAAGYGASLFYVIVYALMSAGVFGLILLQSSPVTESERLSDFSGLSQRQPWTAFLMLVLMFSMMGMPPFLGFFAKLSVVNALIESNLVWMAIIAVLLAVVGAFYYLRIIKIMYFDDPTPDAVTPEPHGAIGVILALNILALLLILPWVGDLMELSRALIPQ